jgi:hypothetical protein
MITLQIDEKEFNIANSYEELTLGQYIDIVKVGESKIQLEGFNADIEIISTISDNREELKKILWDLNLDDFNELKGHFNWVADTTIIEGFKALKPLPKLDIEGVEYGILSNYNKMTLDEVSSFETLLKQEQSDFHRLDIAFGVLLRPMVDGKIIKFSEEVFLEVVKNKYKVKMIDIYATIAFFFNGEMVSTTKNTKRFSILAK